MTHPMQSKIEAAAFWRDHLADRCRSTKRPIAPSRNRILAADIVMIVANWFEIEPKVLTSRTTKRSLIRMRQVAMYLTRKFTAHSYYSIATRYDLTDHTSVIYSCQNIAEKIEFDDELRQDVEELSRILQDG